jgi:hypothetical protein
MRVDFDLLNTLRYFAQNYKDIVGNIVFDKITHHWAPFGSCKFDNLGHSRKNGSYSI